MGGCESEVSEVERGRVINYIELKHMEHIKKYLDNLISNSPLITIPVVTGFGYLFAYQFEVGTAKYYQIPDYLIQIEPLQVIYTAIIIYIVLILVGLIVYLIVFELIPKYSRHLTKNAPQTKGDIITSRIVIFLLILLFLIITPELLGQRVGGENKSYIIIQKDFKHYAIVKSYGDSLIAVEFDAKMRDLKRDILILPKDQPINGTVEFFEDIRAGK